MSLLSLSGLSVRRGARVVLNEATLDIGAGECVGLIGPNGAGKTTLMRAALGLLPHLGTSSLARMPAAARARAAAWLPQTRDIAWPVSVERLVTLGRLPHLRPGQAPGPDDRAAVAQVLERLDLAGVADRPATDLSGGEQARVLIARALVQDTPLILADEPVAGLDPAHQLTTMQTFRALADDGKAALVALHDLGLALRYCTRLVMLQAGRVVADGPPRKVLTAGRVAQVFGITALMLDSAEGPVFQPLAVTGATEGDS